MFMKFISSTFQDYKAKRFQSAYCSVYRAVASLAANGMAAWRSGGFPPLPFKSARPAAVAPNRSLCAGILPIILSIPLHCRAALCCQYGTQFHYFVGLHFVVGMVHSNQVRLFLKKHIVQQVIL